MYIKSALLGCIFTALTMNLASNAQAQSIIISDKDAKLAVSLSQLIETERLLTETIDSVDKLVLDDLSPEERLRHIRQYANGTISLSNSLKPAEILSAYETAIKVSGNKRDRSVFELHRIFLEKVNLADSNENTDELVKKLEKTATDEDWFIANNALLLLSALSASRNNLNVALQQAQEAYNKIPNEISPYVTDARILTLTRTAYLNNFLLNPELAIENTADLIAQKQAAGYPIDGSSLLNNLLYSLSMWRESEVATQIAEIVLELEKEMGSNTPGLTELRVAQLYDQQSDFQNALIHSQKGLKVVEIPALKKALSFVEVNSLAGIGNISEARKKLDKLKEFRSVESRNDAYQLRIAKAELAIAIGNENKENTHKFSSKLLDLTTQNFLRSYNSKTSKLVASLESTKERQAEREASLKREAEQKTRVNQLLMIVVALLSLAMIFAIIFARYRDKISKQLAIKTAQAEDADRMKSEFLGMVSHELRTPLNGIVGIADLLAMQAPTADLRHKAGIILGSSNQLTHVIESIVDMSTIDGDKMELYPEPTNIQAIVTDLTQLWCPTIEAKGVTFTSFVDTILREEVIIDKARFRQCLDSLLSNAAKFTDNGRVHLHVTATSIEETRETEVTAIIADTGQGMSETVQKKLFTPFLQADSTMTRKHGGSGLGLAITQSLARMMGGDVTMVSNQGRGSEFTLTVRGKKSETAQLMDDVENLFDMSPLADMEIVTQSQEPQNVPLEDLLTLDDYNEALIEPAPLTEAEVIEDVSVEPLKSLPPIDTDNLRGLTVLIVEDIPANQDVLKLFLTPEGCKSLCAKNGIEALDILNTQTVDIILMDIRMPQMDGIETTRAIRSSNREYKNIPIIALTADVSAETNAACMAAGADIFLTKPVMARDLIESIRFIRRFQDHDEDASVNAA